MGNKVAIGGSLDREEGASVSRVMAGNDFKRGHPTDPRGMRLDYCVKKSSTWPSAEDLVR